MSRSRGRQPADQEAAEKIHAVFNKIVRALPDYARQQAWTPELLRSDYEELKSTSKELFGSDIFDSNEESQRFPWKPSFFTTYYRFCGLKTGKGYSKATYNQTWNIQLHHIQRLVIILKQRGVNLIGAQTPAADDRWSWLPLLERILDEVTERTGNNTRAVFAENPKPVSIAYVAPFPAASASGARLSERLSGIRSVDAVIELLLGKPHRFAWSIVFRDSFSVLSPDKQEELAALFYKVLGDCWDKSDERSTHIWTMAAGTLTYIASQIEGLRDVGAWDNRLASVFDILSPEKVLLAEPLSYIARIHGKEASFVKNIERMIVDRRYRQTDFQERLRYCGAGRHDLSGIVSVAENIADHLHNRRRFSEILSHDVGRVIEVYPILSKFPEFADKAQSIKRGTIDALKDIPVERKLRGLAEDLMEGRVR